MILCIATYVFKTYVAILLDGCKNHMASNTERSLWGIPGNVADTLAHRGEPALAAWDFFVLIRRAYHGAGREVPPPPGLLRTAFMLGNAGIVRPDRDYPRHYRVVPVPDLPADDIVCLLDRFCHVSHLSAMQRWGLTDRRPHALMISRPDDRTVAGKAAEIMDREDNGIPWAHRPARMSSGPFRLNNIAHPRLVRERPVRLHRSRHAGEAVGDRSGFARVSAIGQTFLDMLRQPGLCGGMDHVLDVWDEHAGSHLPAIITAVGSAGPVIRCRAGHIIEERLGITDPRVEAWRSCAQRGGSRVLDPGRPYAPVWSDAWMISLNA